MNDNINIIAAAAVVVVVVVIDVVVLIVDYITLLNIYMLGNHCLSQNINGIRLSQGREIHPIP